MDALELAVVVPTFNERENVLELARRLETVLAGTPYEIIFATRSAHPHSSSRALPRSVVGVHRRDDGHLRAVHRGDGRRSAARRGRAASMLAKLKSEQLDLVIVTRHAEGGSNAGLTTQRAKLSDFAAPR